MRGVGAVILAGGQSRRMGGKNKAFLKLEGETFLNRIAAQLDGFDELLLSVDDSGRYADCGICLVEDLFPGSGPIGGVYSALQACQSDALLAVSCDIPLFSRGLAAYMLSYLYGEYDAFVVEDRGGRLHPLCGCYLKSAIPVLKEQIASGNLRMMDAIQRLRVRHIPLRHSAYADEYVQNVNAPPDYAAVRGPAIIAVSGIKNSGKTTLLEGIIPLLCEFGLNIAVIKHDGHDFTPDVPGTDSDRLRRAGAKGVAVYSSSRYMLTEQRDTITSEEMVCRFPDADLILLEGGKYSSYPKIEIVRRQNGADSVCDPSTLLALCTDTDLRIDGVPSMGMHAYTEICRVIMDYIERGE